MKKIFVLLGVLCITGLGTWYVNQPKMPEYNPERTYLDMEEAILEAFILAQDSATIELPEGHYLFSQELSINGKKHLTIKGEGMDKTVLSFKGQTKGAQGILISNSENITITNLTIEDAEGDNLKITDSDTVLLRNVRTAWTGRASTENGAYGIYPVLSKNLVIENCEAIGASDAGIYVGQSENVIIRNNKAFYNVAGIESENSTHVEIYNNEIYENTSGLLIFNLPNLTRYGNHVSAHHNTIYNNNTKNFGVKGSIVSAVPKGTGVVIMATQNVSFNNNTVKDHMTSNLSVVSYEIFAADEDIQSEELADQDRDQGIRSVETNYKQDQSYNPYPGQVTISENSFENSYRFPTLSNEYGVLMLMKNKAIIPDVVYDGILPKGASLQDEEQKICLSKNSPLNFVYLDAANNFEGFSNDLSIFNCTLE